MSKKIGEVLGGVIGAGLIILVIIAMAKAAIWLINL
jgi:hypothetical protein